MMIFGLCRIGEASNPGPEVQFDRDIFTLGTFNPSGLRNKSHYIQTHLSWGDVWTVAETHFFGKDLSRFRAGLKAAHSMHKYCITDQSSVRRALLSQKSWKGVGVLSKVPVRPIPSSLPVLIQDSGRALLFTTLFGDAWITGAVIYGEPNAHHYPSFLKNNEHLLHHAAAHVCNLSSGPRFISGDWNVQQDSLPAFGLLAQAGFRDIQDIALERWGQPIQLTCKGKSRPDFMYVSPELADLLTEVEVIHDVWPDHAILCGRFRTLCNAPSMWVWPTPEPFPWPKEFDTCAAWPEGNPEMNQAYADLWRQIEHDAAEVCPYPVSKFMKGRGMREKPKKIRANLVAPVKIGRKGDFQPAFFGTSLKYAQWIRQTRRLQAFARMATNPAVRLGVQKAEAWGAIVRASGFYPCFSTWWQNCEFKTGSAPIACPQFPPAAAVAQEMFDSLSLAVRDLETELRRTSKQYAKFCRDQNPNLVFADIRPPAVPGVDVLMQPIQAVVEQIDPSTGEIGLDKPCDFLPEQCISCDGSPLAVIHHEADALWVEDPAQVQIGSRICQTKFVGSHEDLEREFVAVWKARWMRHAEVPSSRWEAIVNFAKTHLPSMQFHWEPMQPADIRTILKTKKKNTSHGFDGVKLHDLKCMPNTVLTAFCRMFQQSESCGSWPSQLIDGKVVSLAKVPMPGSPADFRPITVFSILYRVWSSFHSKHVLKQLDGLLPETLYGCRPGRYAAQVWSKLLWTVEHAFQHEVDMTGLVADLQKAFNMIPRVAVFEIAGHLGLPGPMLVAWAGALTHMKRRFLLRGSLTAGVPSVTGFPEGCGLSCVAMLLVDFAFHKWQQVFFPMCTALSYVDDWQLLCPHSSMLEGAKFCLDKFVQAVDLQVDQKKTYAWSVTAEGRTRLRGQGFTVVLAAKNLGAHVQVSRKHTNASLMERINGMTDIWPRLRLSACKYETKVRALLVAAWPRALHAIAAVTISDAAFHGLRTGAMKGLSADGAGCNAWVHLGMVEHPLTDPCFWATIQTIRCARDCGDPAQICRALIALTDSDGNLLKSCISATLLTRMQALSWHVQEKGVI